MFWLCDSYTGFLSARRRKRNRYWGAAGAGRRAGWRAITSPLTNRPAAGPVVLSGRRKFLGWRSSGEDYATAMVRCCRDARVVYTPGDPFLQILLLVLTMLPYPPPHPPPPPPPGHERGVLLGVRCARRRVI